MKILKDIDFFNNEFDFSVGIHVDRKDYSKCSFSFSPTVNDKEVLRALTLAVIAFTNSRSDVEGRDIGYDEFLNMIWKDIGAIQKEKDE